MRMVALYYRSVRTLTPKLTHFLRIFFQTLVFCTFLLFSFPKSIQAQTVVFADSFDSGFEKWEPTRDDGTFWSIHNEQLHGYVSDGYTISELIPNDASWNTDWHNIRYEFEYLSLSGADKNISFHFENLTNWYEIHFNSAGMEILRLQDGFVPWQAHRPTTLQNNVQYHITLELNEGQITLYVDDQIIFDDIDPTFTNNYGKVGLKVGTGSIAPTHIVIDNIVVSLLSDPHHLGVERVSQLDDAWSATEYDTAAEWAPEDPSIGAWGCALSSMVMILNYHDITQFADGTTITPETLNMWLTTQPDGYIGDGLLNWLAVTRLTNQISETYQTPNLEFNLINTDITTSLQTEIETHQRPAIVNIPGHFLVAEGVVPQSDPLDFYIQDPAYTYTQLSQHTDEPQSLRFFTPSFTDLSYFLITSESSDATVEVANELQTFQLDQNYSYLSTKDQSQSKETFLQYLAKPESGDYRITVTGSFGTSYHLQFFTYSLTGESTKHSLDGILSSQPTTYLLSFTKNSGLSEIVLQNDPDLLLSDVSYLFAEGEIASHFLWYELTRLLSLTKNYPNQKQLLKEEFVSLLIASKLSVSDQAFAYLQAKIALF